MGFADRDWNRTQTRARPMMQGWSVNGVIIALCVAVFVIDGFLGGRRGSNIVIDRTTLEGAVLPAEFAAAKPAGNAIPLSQAAQQWGPGVIAAAQRVRLVSNGGKVSVRRDLVKR